MDSVVIAPSAFKHDVSEHDMLHAYRNPVRVWDLDEDMTMVVGPSEAAQLLEVGYVVSSDGADVIVHAMPAREKFLR